MADCEHIVCMDMEDCAAPDGVCECVTTVSGIGKCALCKSAPKMLKALKAARQHLLACQAGQIRRPFKSESLVLVEEAIEEASCS